MDKHKLETSSLFTQEMVYSRCYCFFMDKLPLYKLPENWYHLEWDKDKEIYKLVWRSDQQELHIDRLKCQR